MAIVGRMPCRSEHVYYKEDADRLDIACCSDDTRKMARTEWRAGGKFKARIVEGAVADACGTDSGGVEAVCTRIRLTAPHSNVEYCTCISGHGCPDVPVT